MKKQGRNRRLHHDCENVANLLKLLSHPQRLFLICNLVDGERSVGELEKLCGISQSSVSQALTAFRLLGLVERRRQGQHVFYRIADARLLRLVNTLWKLYASERSETV